MQLSRVLLLAALSAACGPLAPDADIEGSYTLRDIGGSAVPVTIHSIRTISTTIELKRDRSAVITSIFAIVENGTVGPTQTVVEQGSWFRADDDVALVWTSMWRSKYRIENDGRALRTIAESFDGPGIDVLHIKYLTRD